MMEFFSHLLLFNFLICTYLNDLKLNYSFFLFAWKFNVMYLFKILILVFKVVKKDEDVIKHGKIVW
jgi:hypothetical protein